MSLKVWLPLISRDGVITTLPRIYGTDNLRFEPISIGISTSYFTFNGTSTRLAAKNERAWGYPLSVCAWIQGETITSTNTEYIISYNTASGGTAGHNIGIGTLNGKLTIWHGGVTHSYDTSLVNGLWYHVAATVTATDYALYLNGTKVVSGTATNSDVNSRWITIGARSNSSTGGVGDARYYFKGNMNDIRIYDHCLSDAEVKELARGLALHYKMGYQNIKNNILENSYNFTASNFALTRATVPETGLLQITPTASGAYAKYKTNLEYPDANNKRYVVSFDAREIEASDSTYTTDYIRFYYGFTPASRRDVIIGSADYYTYRNIPLLGTGWQHYVAIFGVPDPLELGDSTVMTDGALLAFLFGRRATKKPILIKNIKLELDSETIVYDSSGFGHNGEVISDIVYDTNTPRYETCTHFEATSEKIKIPYFPTNYFTDSYSFVWWGKVTQSSVMLWGFSNGILLNGVYKGNLWNTGDGSNNPLYIPNTTTQVTAPALSVWHHWAMTGDGTSCKVYLDGELFGVAKTYKSISGNLLYINGWNSSTDYSSNNLSISDFRIYRTALDADAVKLLYELGAKIDNKKNTFVKEFKEETGINRLYKTSIYETNSLIEHESGPSLSPVEWQYQPAANTNNSSIVGVVADFSAVKDLGIPITIKCEYDISWNNVAPAAEGAFLARIQGSITTLAGAFDWNGTNYLIPDSYSLTSTIRNNSTGTLHYSFTKTIPADWFQSYYQARIGFRVNYCDGNGTISCSNVKITYLFDNVKMRNDCYISNQFIEN